MNEAIDWGYALQVTAMGIVTVLLMLIILIGVIELQKAVLGGSKAKATSPASQPVASVAKKEENKDADQLEAVIATAIHLHMQAKNNAKVITINRITNSPWNTKEFSMTNNF